MHRSMPNILSREVQRALTTLKTAGEYGVKYYVEWPGKGKVMNIELPVQAASFNQRASNRWNPRFKELYIGVVTGMKVGDVGTIKAGNADIEGLRASAAAWCTTNWGKRTYTTAMDRTKGVIEIYRYK